MSFIRSSDGQSRLKYSRSLAYDTRLNNRNLEDAWYPMWNFVLAELIEQRPNLHVAPQCTLWIGKIRPPPGDVTPDEDEPELDPEPDPEHSAPKQPTPLLQNSTRNTRRSQKAREDSSGVTPEDIETAGRRRARSTVVKSTKATPVIAESSTNIISRRRPGPRDSTATTAAPDALERIPDFAIFHTQVERDQTKPFYDGLRVVTLSIPIIVEIKGFVSRRLVGEARDKAIRDVLYATQDQVLEQAGVLFLSKGVDRVRGIAACGPYWTTAEVTRNHIDHATWERLKKALDPDHPYEPRPVTGVRCNWLSVVEIEDHLSNQRLQSLRSFLASLQ